MREFLGMVLFVAAVLVFSLIARNMWDNCRLHHSFWHCVATKGWNL